MLLLFVCVGFLASLGSTTEVEDLKWWQKSIIYQIYPRSFQDSNGDGVGDLKGITSRLDYLQYLNVDTVWLSPFFESPMVDHGYDISNHTQVDPVFGDMEDFDAMIKAMHKRGIKLILDYIPNHTSDKHPWFQASRQGAPGDKYTDFYVWHRGTPQEDASMGLPNNWESMFGEPSWTWDPQRQAYYLHQFAKEQPDLNYRNPEVLPEMMKIFQFWLDKGVDGFRIDAIQTLYEVEDFRDDPRSFKPGSKQFDKDYLTRENTINQPEIHDVTRAWRKLFDEHQKKTGKDIFMVTEVYDPGLVKAMEYYHSGSDMPFNFQLISINTSCDALCFHKLIDDWMQQVPEGKWPGFVIGNHDNKRVTRRKGPEYVDALNILLLTLPGTPTTYQGEELGLMEISVSYEDTQDPWGKNLGPERYEEFSRDPCRAPMQWEGGVNAGFSTAKNTWLPVHPDYLTRNVQAQRDNPLNLHTPLQIYRRVADLRKQKAFLNANIDYVVVNKNILSYVRQSEGTPAYLVTLNLGGEMSTDNYSAKLKEMGLKDNGIIAIVTGSVIKSDPHYREGKKLNLNKVTLNPGDGLVVLLTASQQSKEEL